MHLLDDKPAPSSAEIAERVQMAQYFRAQRDQKAQEGDDETPLFASDMRPFLEKIVQEFEITGRGYEKIIKVARTIADLDHSELIQHYHLKEALAYRKIRLLS